MFAAGDAPSRPDWLPRERWDALVQRVAAWLGGTIVRRALEPGLALRSAEPDAPLTSRFGRGMSITAIPDRRDAVELRVVAERLEEPLRDRPVLVVFQRATGEILAVHELTPFEGALTLEIAADAQKITDDDVEVILIGMTHGR